MKKKIFFVLYVFCTHISVTLVVNAQKKSDISDTLTHYAPKGHFLYDSTHIGEPIAYMLTAKYPSHWQVLFPDTTYRLEPFLLLKKQAYFTSSQVVSSKKISTDSVLYRLALFGMKPIQTLKMPIWIVREKDTLKLFSNQDSIFLKMELPNKAILDTISVKKNTKWMSMTLESNFWEDFLEVFGVISILMIIGIFFGNWFVKQFNLLNLQRRQIIFDTNFEQLLNRIKSRKRIKDIENSLILWKRYLEDLEKIPFSTYTSKEISTLLQIPQLTETLQNLDKVIYGQMLSESISEDLLFLQTVAKQRSNSQKQQFK